MPVQNPPDVTGPPPQQHVYTFPELEQLWIQAGGNPAQASMAAAIAMAESSGEITATNHNTNGTTDRGLWQINSIHGIQSTYSVIDNVKAAIAISNNGANWRPWSTYTNGAYRRYLSNAPPTPAAAMPPMADVAQTPAAAPAPAPAPSAASDPNAPPSTSAGLNALDDWIKVNYPTDAWLLNIPEVRSVIENAVHPPGGGGPMSPDQIKALVAQTAWWKKTAQSLIAYEQLKYQNPADLNFNNPGSKASAVLANVKSLAGTMGAQYNPAALQYIATETMMYGWNDTQVKQRLGQSVYVNTKGAGVTSNDPALLAQLTKAAGNYLVNPNQTVLNQYARTVAMGTQTEADWEAYLQGQAAAKYPSMAAAIKAGMTPSQIVDPLRQDAAKLMEVNPDQVDFISNPMYSKILTYRPPDAGNKVEPIRTMTSSEMETYLRGTTPYSYTQGARNEASDLSNSILTTFGKVAGT